MNTDIFYNQDILTFITLESILNIFRIEFERPHQPLLSGDKLWSFHNQSWKCSLAGYVLDLDTLKIPSKIFIYNLVLKNGDFYSDVKITLFGMLYIARNKQGSVINVYWLEKKLSAFS